MYPRLLIGNSCPPDWKWCESNTPSVSSEMYPGDSSSINERPFSRASSEGSNGIRDDETKARTTRRVTTTRLRRKTTAKTNSQQSSTSAPTRRVPPRLAPPKKASTSNNKDKSSDLKPGTLGSRQQVKPSTRLQLPTHLAEKQLSFRTTNPALELIDTNNYVDESIVCFPKEFCQRAGISEVPADVYSLCKKIKISVVDIELN